MNKAKPNASHAAVRSLGRLGLVNNVITQNVDSFHPEAHPEVPTIELHGYLRSLICISCHNEQSRSKFQTSLAALNPTWAAFLNEMLAVGALDSEDPMERTLKGLKSNPDGDVEVPDAPYTTFRYPPCPACLSNPPELADGTRAKVEVDVDGAWSPISTAGILKPAVVMFGESIAPHTKNAAERAINDADRVLVIGSSLATYSAWRLVKQAKERRIPIAVVNVGGIRGEEFFFADTPDQNTGELGVRASDNAEKLLPIVVGSLERSSQAPG